MLAQAFGCLAQATQQMPFDCDIITCTKCPLYLVCCNTLTKLCLYLRDVMLVSDHHHLGRKFLKVYARELWDCVVC